MWQIPTALGELPTLTHVGSGDWLGGKIVITQIISANPSWFGFVFQLPRDGVQRSCHLLVRCDKTPKKPQKQDDDAYDASEINKHEESG
jgi:hypothetical protein